MTFILGACNNIVFDEAESDESKTVASSEESTDAAEAAEENAVEEKEADVEEAVQEEEWIAYEDMEQPSVQYIKDISPNDLALEIEKNQYDYPVVNEENLENYVQRFDLDSDGNEEEIKILMDGTYSGEHASFILAIYDHRGNPKYAEYLYNAESVEKPMPILTVAELTGDGFLEIVIDSTRGYGYMEGNGDQSISRLVYGFDAYTGNFRQLPAIGSYYDIVWQEDVAVQIDERVSGLSDILNYREKDNESVDLMIEHGLLDDYDSRIGQRLVGESRRVYPEKAMKLNEADEHFSLAVVDVIHDIPDLSIISKNLYQWNETYEWFEVVGSNFTSLDDDTFSFKKPLYTPAKFNGTFGTGDKAFEDYMGSWQMVIDGKLQSRYLDIEEEVIYETERDLKDYEQVIEREITIEDYVYKEETGQLIPRGVMKPFLDQPYNKEYQNLFTLLEIDNEVMLMDQYGHLYVEEGNGDREPEEDGWVYSAEAEDVDSIEEVDQPVSIETSIDVLSPDFMNEYFAGPEPYTFDGIEEGMSQTEVENLLGLPEEYYAVEGAEFAVYDNLAILYSQYFPTRSGAFEHINPDENFVTDTEVILRVPHEEVVAAYGEPTLSYEEYSELGPGPGRDQTIYDHTRGNGYAIYIEVGLSGTAWLMTKDEEWDLLDED
ncbi:hypothetical protein LPW40_00195 [Salinicoccus halitifaciens]|nr:hypothetical protein [Salinicoccus halitifaciens]